MIGRTNAGGGGAPNKSTIIVTAPTGSTVTCSMGTTTKTAAEKNGTWTFSGLDNGTWTITATKSGQTATKSVIILRLTVEYVTITYFSATINITYPAGSTCTAENGSTTLTAPNTNGTWACVVPNAGDWTVSCTDGTQTASKTISITADGQSVSASLNYNTIPEFTYTGDYETVDDDDNPITTSDGNWKIRFLTSGTLTFTNLNGAEGGIDIFLVGGGGGACGTNSEAGGGGGGYTKTVRAVQVLAGVAYQIVVGAGGKPTKGGGSSSAFNESVEGGKSNSTTTVNGADGGSGGGVRGDGNRGVGGRGGSDGSDGFHGTGDRENVGRGQKTTTREFGESANKLYSGGGAGGSTGGAAAVAGGAGGGGNGGADDGVDTAATPGETNTGGGGGGGYMPAAGGSGIVIARNARGAA